MRRVFQNKCCQIQLFVSSTQHFRHTLHQLHQLRLHHIHHLHLLHLYYILYTTYITYNTYINSIYITHASSTPSTSSSIIFINTTNIIYIIYMSFIYITCIIYINLDISPTKLLRCRCHVQRSCYTRVLTQELLQRNSCTRAVTLEMLHRSQLPGDLLVSELLQNSYFSSSSKFSLLAEGAAKCLLTKRNLLRRWCVSGAQTCGEMLNFVWRGVECPFRTSVKCKIAILQVQMQAFRTK